MSQLLQELAGQSTGLKQIYHQRLDQLELEMLKSPAAELPVRHKFTPGLYIREIYMPAGSLLTSKIHKTQHPYVISQGRVSVLTEDQGWVELSAPHMGITLPGTRRLLYIHEDTIWTTFHPTDLTDVNEIEEQIIEKHDEHRIGLVQPVLKELL